MTSIFKKTLLAAAALSVSAGAFAYGHSEWVYQYYYDSAKTQYAGSAVKECDNSYTILDGVQTANYTRTFLASC